MKMNMNMNMDMNMKKTKKKRRREEEKTVTYCPSHRVFLFFVLLVGAFSEGSCGV